MSSTHVRLQLKTVQGSDLVIEYADELAEFFFRADASSTGKHAFDAHIAADPAPCRIRPEDITAVNTTMSARTSPKHWATFTEVAADKEWLCALDPGWDLFAMPEKEWLQQLVHQRLGDAFAAVVGPYRGPAVTTKVLHIKRPRLIPVCDSYVAGMMGVQFNDGFTWRQLLNLVLHLRRQGQANLDELETIQQRLADAGYDRTLVRILDALLWMGFADAGPYAAFAYWLRRTYGPEEA
jgi:hypothetical protein